jgi:hypothetical protein
MRTSSRQDGGSYDKSDASVCKLSVNDIVQHDYSKVKGRIRAILIRMEPYRYFVVWETGDADWYKRDVLVKHGATDPAHEPHTSKKASTGKEPHDHK